MQLPDAPLNAHSSGKAGSSDIMGSSRPANPLPGSNRLQHGNANLELMRGMRVAFSMSNAIGDSLVCMVIVQNLLRHGADVTVFNGPLNELRPWFPSVRIFALPVDQAFEDVLAGYDIVFQMKANEPLRLMASGLRVITLHDVEYGDRSGCMAQRFMRFCRNELGIATATIGNGMVSPNGLIHRRCKNRVLIHPEASTEDKRWLPDRFVKVAKRLQEKGFEVVFVMAPHERERWAGAARAGIVIAQFTSLDELGRYLYESGWFIGNDSGLGHLASSLDIPSLILFKRRRVSKRWRPGWGQVTVVLPRQCLPGTYLKEKLWRLFLTCTRVLQAFEWMTGQKQPQAPLYLMAGPTEDTRQPRM